MKKIPALIGMLPVTARAAARVSTVTHGRECQGNEAKDAGVMAETVDSRPSHNNR